MEECIPQEVCRQYGGRIFQTITVTGKKGYLGTILEDLARCFQRPQSLRLDLWYGLETEQDLNQSEAVVKEILKPWHGAKVLFVRFDQTVLKEFVISYPASSGGFKVFEWLYSMLPGLKKT